MKSITNKIVSSILVITFLMLAVLTLTACAHEHNFASTYSFDATHHWQECLDKNCEEKQNYEEHNLEGDICTVCHYGSSAAVTVGTTTTYYKTFAEAIATVTDDTATTITLTKDVTEGGVVVQSGKNLTLDLNGHTYTLVAPMVGSSGTTTIGFQLLKDSNITIKNGTIKHATAYTEARDDQDCKMLIQNYSNLTLENVTLDARSADNVCLYALSDNYGNIVLKGNTNIIAAQGQVAFDVWFGEGATYYTGVNVTFDETFTGTVSGKVEYGAKAAGATNVPTWTELTKLTIKAGTFNLGEIDNLNNVTMNIEISGGSFDIDVSNYVKSGYECNLVSGRYVVTASAN